MNNLTKNMQQIEDEINILDEQIRSHCIAWAQESIDSLGETEIPSNISQLAGEISSSDHKIDTIRTLLSERKSLSSRSKEIHQAESEMIKSQADFYLVVGKRSFEIFKKGSLAPSSDLDSLFKPLLDYEDKIRNADNELYKIRSLQDEKGVFLRVGSFIKKSSQTTIKKTASDSLVRHYKKAGEALIKEGLFTEIAQNGLSDIYEEFQDKQGSSLKLTEEQKELESKLKVIDLTLDELSPGHRPEKTIIKLEEDQTEIETELDQEFLRRGKELYGMAPQGDEPFRDLISQLNKSREEKIKAKKILLTEIRIAELDVSLEKIKKEVDHQKEKVSKEKEKLSALQKENKEIQSRKDELSKEWEGLKK